MLPGCWQLPTWTWETCTELDCRPPMTISIVKLPGRTVTVIAPVALVLIPLSLKLSTLGEGVGLELTAARLGEGEATAMPPPKAPQAEVGAASATSPAHRFIPAVSRQSCSRLYRCRLLDADRRSAS